MSSHKVRRKAPNIVRGGRAIPFGNPTDNLYYLQGRSHAKGGIDIGENSRTGIEAEGGEVVQIKPNELRVLSAQDFIGGGISPAKQVLAGANPDRVFNEQERFKDRHRINDDGSRYETGGDKIYDGETLPTVDIVGDYNTYWRATKKKKANQVANAARQGTSDFIDYILNGPITNAIELGSLITSAGLGIKKGIDIGKHLINNYKDYKAIKDFMTKYGYKGVNPKVSIIFSDKNLDRVANNLVKRHNTFARGVDISDYDKAKKALTTVPKSVSPYNHGLNDFENALYTSNSISDAARYAGEDGYIGILSRDIKRGQSTRRQFLIDNDFKLTAKPDLYDSKFLRLTDEPYKHYKAFISGSKEYDNYIKIANDIYDKKYKGENITKKLRDKIFKEAKIEYNKKYNADIPVDNEIRGNKGILYHPDDNGYRHYLFIGDTGNEPLKLERMIKSNDKKEFNTEIPSIGLSRKKRNGGMIASINGNIKNGLIVTPRYKCGGKRKKAEGGTSETIYDAIDRMNKEQLALQDSIDTGYYLETDTGFIRNPNILDEVVVNPNNNNENDGGIRLDDKSVPRNYGKGTKLPSYLFKPDYVTDYDKVREQEIQDVVDRFTIGAGLPSVRRSDESNSSSTGDKNKTEQTSDNTQTTNSSTESKSKTPRRRSTLSTPTNNNYSITNYEIQPNGTLKVNGTRTGRGRKEYEYKRRNNQRSITDARVSKSWRETIGSDADVLNAIAFGDNFENMRIQDSYSKIQQETNYNPNSGRAIKHEDVSRHSRRFNDRFNLANRKLGEYTTPAGRTGDNATGERRKKFGGRRKAVGGTTVENRERPYEDQFAGAQVYYRNLGSKEDLAYLQDEVNKRRGPNLPQRALFVRPDNLIGGIDALETPKVKGLNVDAPKIDLGPIGKTVVPEVHTRVAQRDALNRAPFQKNWRDEIGLGLGLAGSIIDPILRGRQLRNLESWMPYTESPVKLKTNWNINPQLDRIRESSQEAYRDIDANTASSSTALARKQRVRNQAQYATNQQWGLKENKETELINQDKLNLQGVRNRNTNRLNTWAADNARIRNQITMAKADNISNAIQNVVGVGLDYLGRKDFKDYVNNTKAAIAAGAPNVDDRILKTNGLNLGDLYNTGIPTLATNTYRRGKFGSRIKIKRK